MCIFGKRWTQQRELSTCYNTLCCSNLMLMLVTRQQHKNKGANCRIIYIYRVSQEECARLREGVPYVKVYRYNPKHLCPKLNGYGDNCQRKMWSSCGSTHCTCQLTILSIPDPESGVAFRQFS